MEDERRYGKPPKLTGEPVTIQAAVWLAVLLAVLLFLACSAVGWLVMQAVAA